MQIPREIRDCVVFVAYKTSQNVNLCGTAFVVSVPIEGTSATAYYAVTARHVLDGIKERSVDGDVGLRVNMRDGTVRFIRAPLTAWEPHPDSRVDVAVAEFPIGLVDHKSCGVDAFATDSVIQAEGIGIGDEVFLVGLFTGHQGEKRNIPIARTGAIAAMPEEPVLSSTWGYIDAYLIEARSIGGISGSPVFVYLGPERHGGDPKHKHNWRFYLLGLIHGHWGLPLFETDEVQADSDFRRSINMGIALVVPSHRILELLNSEEFAERRRKGAQAFLSEQADSRAP